MTTIKPPVSVINQVPVTPAEAGMEAPETRERKQPAVPPAVDPGSAMPLRPKSPTPAGLKPKKGPGDGISDPQVSLSHLETFLLAQGVDTAGSAKSYERRVQKAKQGALSFFAQHPDRYEAYLATLDEPARNTLPSRRELETQPVLVAHLANKKGFTIPALAAFLAPQALPATTPTPKTRLDPSVERFAAAVALLQNDLAIGYGGEVWIKEGQKTQTLAALAALSGKDPEEGAALFECDGDLIVNFDEHFTAEAKADLKLILERTTIDAAGRLWFNSEGLVKVELDGKIKHIFGDRAGTELTASGDLKITCDHTGLSKIQTEVKAKFGDVRLNASLKYNSQTKDALRLAAFTSFKLAGGKVETTLEGDVKISHDGQLQNGEIAALIGIIADDRVDVGVGGILTYKNGSNAIKLGTQLSAALDQTEIIGEGAVVFKDGKQFYSGGVKALFPNAELGFTIEEDPNDPKRTKLGAYTLLKRAAGSIEMRPGGAVFLHNGTVDRVQLSQALSLLAGEEVKVDLEGKITYVEGGDPILEFAHNLKAVLDAAKLDSSGRIFVQGDNHSLEAKLKILFPDSKVATKASIKIASSGETEFDFALESLGDGARIEADGRLKLGKRARYCGFNVTTNLVKEFEFGKPLGDIVFAENHDSLAAGGEAGAKIKGTLGVAVGARVGVKVLKPTKKDPVRYQMVQQEGAFYAERTLNAKLNLAPGGEVSAGMFSAGLSYELGSQRTVKAITVHPNRQDAAHLPNVGRLRLPKTLAAAATMQPGELIQVQGNHSHTVRGSVGIGPGMGPVKIGIKGEAFYKFAGRTGVRLFPQGDNIVVELVKGRSDITGGVLGLNVGLSGDILPGGGSLDGLTNIAKGVVESLAQMSFERSHKNIKEGDTLVRLVFSDPEDPAAQAAYAAAYHGDFGKAQEIAEQGRGSVEVTQKIHTDVVGTVKSTTATAPGLTYESTEAWLRQVKRTVGKNIATTQAAQHKLDPLAPWQPTITGSVGFYHLRPDGNQEPAGANLKPPVVKDTKAFLRFNWNAFDQYTSAANLFSNDPRSRVARLIDLARFLDVPAAKLTELEDLAKIPDAGLTPRNQGIILGLGDNRGASRVTIEGIIPHDGMTGLFHGASTDNRAAWRTPEDYVSTYLDAAATVTGRAHILSEPGLLSAMERTLGVAIDLDQSQKVPIYVVSKNGAQLGTLTPDQLRALKHEAVRQVRAGATSLQLSRGQGDRYGTWAATAPSLLVAISADELATRKDLVAEANAYARDLGAAQELYKSILGKEHESPAAPFYARLEAVMERLQSRDKKSWLITQVAMMKHVSQKERVLSIQVDLDQEAVRDVITNGAAKMVDFAAFGALVGKGRLLGDHLVISDPNADQALLIAAAEALFGHEVHTSTTTGGALAFSNLHFADAAQKAAFAELFAAAAWEEDRLVVKGWEPANLRRTLALAFGRHVTVNAGGAVVFDNRGFDKVHVADAIRSAFGPKQPRLPTLEPFVRQGKRQTWNVKEGDFGFRFVGSGVDPKDLTTIAAAKPPEWVSEREIEDDDSLSTPNRRYSQLAKDLDYAVETRDLALMERCLLAYKNKVELDPASLTNNEIREFMGEVQQAIKVAEAADNWTIWQTILGILLLFIPFLYDALHTNEAEALEELADELRAKIEALRNKRREEAKTEAEKATAKKVHAGQEEATQSETKTAPANREDT